MNFLYGDSSPSPLKSNFLEFLRDAIDFSVFALQADDRIKQGKARIDKLAAEADAETGRLDRFIAVVTRAVDEGDKGLATSATAACALRLADLVAEAHRSSTSAIRQALADDVARVEAEEAETRAACALALATLLAPHEPPGARVVLRAALEGSGRYGATLIGQSPELSLDWTFDLGAPEPSAWATPLRVERLVPQLEIMAPQLSGWITKEVKVRPLKLERHVVTELVDDGALLRVKLRAEQDADAGLDLTLEADSSRLTVRRVGPEDDASVGPFDPSADDTSALVALLDKLRASVAELERSELVAATFDGADFKALASFVPFVERLVATMAPVVREIAARSLTPNELVIRRALSNDRREEIFVPKVTLRDKYAALAEPLRALFAPLGLDPQAKEPPKPPPAPQTKSERPPPVRAELPRSQPPPPRSKPPPPPPVPRKAPEAPPVPVVEMSADALADVPPESDSGPSLPTPPDGQGRNEALVAALKKIVKLSKNGRADDAYAEYERLFSSEEFSGYRADDQRQAIKLMVLGRPPQQAAPDAVADAHRAAMLRLRALAEAASDPADYELLGLTCQRLDDAKGAGEAFRTALDLERAQNPQSERVATLMKRVSET